MDPIERIDIDKDTSFVFILEAQQRGHDNYYCGISGLAFNEGRVIAHAAPLKVQRKQGEHADIGGYLWRDAAEFDCILMRKDPPFDTDFFFATHLLSLVDESRTLLFNNPRGLREASEKMFILNFPELIAETMVAADPAAILEFAQRVGGDIVVKPLDGCGGAGIFRITRGDLNTNAILEVSTGEGRRPIMAQRYLPKSREGDTRLHYLDGQAVGAMKRVPQQNDLRGNLHVGGRSVRAEIGEKEREICKRVAPRLSELGIYYAGLDIIGGYVTEVNVTSPTGIQETNALSGLKLEAEVIDMVERKCAALKR